MPAEDYLFRTGSIQTTRDRLRRLAMEAEPPKLYARPTVVERTGWACLAVAGVAVCLGIVYAVVATATTPWIRPETVQAAGPSLPRVTSLSPPPAFLPAPMVVQAAPISTATHPLQWEDLTLMLRTGLQDDEIIAEAGGKQLVLFIDPSHEQALRSLGAGDRLIGYLRAQRVYAAPEATAAARVTVSAQPVALATAAHQPAPAATPDYAARDRQIQSLRTQIDALDEQVRCIRTNPKDRRYWWHYSGSFNGLDQQKLDAYLDDLDKQRNDLRRQKWQLEGR